MNTLFRSTLMLALMALPLSAQPGPDPGHRAQRIGRNLQLTEAQKPAWIRFADAVKAASEPQARLCADLAGKPAPVALPDRLDRAERLASVRLAEIQAVRPALTELYGQLTPDQQKVADGLVQEHGGHHGGN